MQEQFLHRTLITNRKLNQFGIKDSEKCDNCDQVETIAHLLYECNIAQRIWHDIEQWSVRISPNPVYTDKKSVLLGNKNNEVTINFAITIIKHEIYKSKWNRSKLDIYKIKKNLKSHTDLEIYIATSKNNLPKHLVNGPPFIMNFNQKKGRISKLFSAIARTSFSAAMNREAPVSNVVTHKCM